VLAPENSAVFCFETDVAGVGSYRNDGAVKLDTQKVFEMFLDFNEVVLIHLQKGVVESVAKISLAAIGEGDEISKSLDIFFMIGTGD